MSQQNQPCEPHLHAFAVMVARKCRHAIGGVLSDSERQQCDTVLYAIIRQAFEDFREGEKR
jgi:hypothetical protein